MICCMSLWRVMRMHRLRWKPNHLEGIAKLLLMCLSAQQDS